MKKKTIQVVTLMFFVLLLALYVSIDAGLLTKKELPVDYSGTKSYVDSIKKTKREKVVYTDLDVILDTSAVVEEKVRTPSTQVNNNEERLRILSSSKSGIFTPVDVNPIYKTFDPKMEPESALSIKKFERPVYRSAKLESGLDFKVASSSKYSIPQIMKAPAHPGFWEYQLWKIRNKMLLDSLKHNMDSLQ